MEKRLPRKFAGIFLHAEPKISEEQQSHWYLINGKLVFRQVSVEIHDMIFWR